MAGIRVGYRSVAWTEGVRAPLFRKKGTAGDGFTTLLPVRDPVSLKVPSRMSP